MEVHSESLREVIYLLAAAVVVVTLFKKLNLDPVLGYFAAGIGIGPYGFSIISDIKTTSYLAEFGVVFLLFYIGLELTFDRLKSMRKHVFGFGTLQLIITGLLIGLVAFYIFKVSAAAAIIIGGALALSSTAVVLELLNDRNEQSTQVGRLSLAVLILQDLAVVPLLVLVPLLADQTSTIGAAILDAVVKAAIALVIMFFAGKFLLRPLFRVIGSLKSRELFSATTIFIVLIAAWGTSHAGLSLALGAFMAGLMVAETEFRHQVEADIMPFKGLLLGLFFMTVGMSIDIYTLIKYLPMVIIASVVLVVIKTMVYADFSNSSSVMPYTQD